MPCSALVAQARRSPGETHGAQCATPRSVGQLLAAPPTPDSARGRIRPAEHDGSVISAHRRAADQGVKDLLCCACSTPALALPTRILGVAGNVQCSARRCAVKLNFWHSPGYVCKYPGRTIQPCFVGGMATCSCRFPPALPALALSPSRKCQGQSTQMCCALHTSAQTAQYDCRGTL